MAINFTDFSRAPILESPAKNMFENVLKGYQISQEPAKMKEEQSARELANQLRKLEVEHKPKEYALSDQHQSLANSLSQLALKHKPKEYELSDSLKQAQIEKAKQPAALKGALAQAFQLRQSLDPQSPTYENDKAAINKYIDKLGTPSKGVQISSSPDGGFEVSVGGQGETAQVLGLPALKKGETYLFDENNKPIGIGKPYTESEKKEEKGRAAFNVWQQFITDAQAPYSGKGATVAFEDDVKKYGTDAAATERIDKLIASDKLLFSNTVKEEATLGGANTNQAYNKIMHSLEISEIPQILRSLSKYQLPRGYTKASSDLFKKMLNEGTEAGKNIPAYQPYYFNKPQQQVSPNNSSNGSVQAPSIPKTVTNRKQFQSWLKTLTPAQRNAVKAQHVGEK